MGSTWPVASRILVAGVLVFIWSALGSTRRDEIKKADYKNSSDEVVSNTRYSESFQINADTVRDLGATWISDKFDDAATSHVTPVVNQGLMFVSAEQRFMPWTRKRGKRSGSIKRRTIRLQFLVLA